MSEAELMECEQDDALVLLREGKLSARLCARVGVEQIRVVELGEVAALVEKGWRLFSSSERTYLVVKFRKEAV